MGSPEQERHAAIAAHIHRLISTPEWDMFTREVKDEEQQAIDRLVTSKTDDEFNRGLIRGIRTVMKLPQILIARGRRS